MPASSPRGSRRCGSGLALDLDLDTRLDLVAQEVELRQSPRPHRGAQAGGRGLADELLRSLIGGEAEELGGRNALGESSGLPTRDLLLGTAEIKLP